MMGMMRFRKCKEMKRFLAFMMAMCVLASYVPNVGNIAFAEGEVSSVSGEVSKDASTDASKDASTDASKDASTDASKDASTDASKDASTDASKDASTDVSKDASTDASKDASTDASKDASKDASSNAGSQNTEATTTESTTTEATITTTEATTTESTTTEATTADPNKTSDGRLKTKDMTSSFGVALMAGEKMTISFKDAETIYIPFSTGMKGYLRINRVDAKSGTVKVRVLKKNKSTAVYTKASIAKKTSTKQISVDKASYYLALTAKKNVTVTITADIEAGLDLKDGNNCLTLKKNKYNYFTYVATKTGYLNVENLKTVDTKIAICNESKKAYTADSTMKKYTADNHKYGKNQQGFGVTKGTTYIIRLKSSVKAAKVKLSITSYTGNGGETYAKAKALSGGKVSKGTLAPGCKACYYSFKKSGYNSIRISVSTKNLFNQGKMKVSLYYKEITGSKKGQILPVKLNGSQVAMTQGAEYAKSFVTGYSWPNTTYYIKVENTSKSTGCYTISVK